MTNFQRTKNYAYFCLGKRQKSKRKYRRPRGRHNKMRQKWGSRTPMVEVGYKNMEKTRGLINSKTPLLINNIKELDNIGKDNVIIISNVGKKKRLEIAKEILKRKLEVYNMNLNKFIKENEKKIQEKK